MSGRLPSRIATAIERLPEEHRWEAASILEAILAAHPGDELSVLSGVAGSNEEPEEHRVAAIWSISRCWRGSVVVETLIRILGDRSAPPAVRSAAAEGLSQTDRTATASLVRAIDAEESSALREVAITSMGPLGDIAALPALTALLRNDAEHVSLRALAAEAIGEIAVFTPEATGQATAILRQVAGLDNPPALTFGIARALANIATPEAGSVLRTLLPEIGQSDAELREHIESVLNEIGESP